MEKKKFKIEELKIQSFITDVNQRIIKGGETDLGGGDFCAQTPELTMIAKCWTGPYCGGGDDGGTLGEDCPGAPVPPYVYVPPASYLCPTYDIACTIGCSVGVGCGPVYGSANDGQCGVAV